MTRVEVNPGVCGFVTTIRAQGDSEGRVHVEVESGCPAVRQLAGQLKAIDPLMEKGTVFGSSAHKAADACLKHPDCVVPVAILRAVNVEAGLALPAEVSIRFQKE